VPILKELTLSTSAVMKSLPEMVHDYLREGILSGSLLPAESIRQDDVANRLGVSRAPVREALNQLEREGLVVLRPRRGYVVASLDGAEIEEIFQIRMLLEEYAARLAAERRTPQHIAALKGVVQAMKKIDSCTPENLARMSTLDGEFHATMFGATRQPRLVQIIRNLRDVVEHYVRVYAHTATFSARHLRDMQSEHQQIFVAFEAGDAEKAARVSRIHCQRIRDRLMASLRELSDERSAPQRLRSRSSKKN
jgi:DNA-binding GntR family transcriptional regulator